MFKIYRGYDEWVYTLLNVINISIPRRREIKYCLCYVNGVLNSILNLLSTVSSSPC